MNVSATMEGGTLDLPIDKKGQQDLLQVVVDSIVDEARDAFPCMEWSANPSPVATSAASLRAIARVVSDKSSRKLTLSYYATLPQRKKFSVDWSLTLRDPLRDMEYGFAQFADLFRRKIAGQFRAQHFRDHINRVFITEIPIAHRVYIENERAIVPVDAVSMRLSSSSPIAINLDRPICTPPVTACRIGYKSAGIGARGTTREGMLYCNLNSNPCCDKDSWPPGNTAISEGLDLPVYLGGDHGHCSPGQVSCDEISHTR